MATIAGIIKAGKGTAGSHGSWKVEKLDSDPYVGTEYALWHYGTCMMLYRRSKRHGVTIRRVSLGHGSVSDQHGMNIAFRELGIRWYYSRKDMAILDIDWRDSPVMLDTFIQYSPFNGGN